MMLPDGGKWAVGDYELAVLNSICAARSPESVFEFGTFTGRTTMNLAANMPTGSTIRTIDLPDGVIQMPDGTSAGEDIERHRQLVESVTIERLYADCRTYDFSHLAGTQELIFIDAGHGYASAAADTKSSLLMTRGRRAVILWHDYRGHVGVTRAVDELLESPPRNDLFAIITGTTMACLIRQPD